MTRSTWVVAIMLVACGPPLPAQHVRAPRRYDPTSYANSYSVASYRPSVVASYRRSVVHYGKWLTAGAAVAFTAMAVHEHGFSRRDWDDLLVICRSADNACERNVDGTYLRADAEFLYQRSIYYDARANRRLLGAQGSLLVTAALFIIDLSRRNEEPDNIPFSPLRVTLEPGRDGSALVGWRLRF